MGKKKFLPMGALGIFPKELGVSEIVPHGDFQRFTNEDDSKLLRIARELRELADSLEAKVFKPGR